jgi:hypothetical protein
VIRFRVPGIGIAGVGVSSPMTGFITPVRRTAGEISTGVAIQNVGDKPITVELTLCDEYGEPVPNGTQILEDLPAMGHQARYIHELFPEADTDNFAGTLVVSVEGGQVAAMAIEMGSEAGQFTTLPVMPLD